MFKKGDKVILDNKGTVYEGILVSNPYRVFTQKEICVDVYINSMKEQIPINIKYIKKIDEMKKINALEIHKKVSIDELYNKLDEEVKEIAAAILLSDVENLTEELLDAMQVIKGIAYKFNIDLDANIEKHNKKLLNRGHKFI